MLISAMGTPGGQDEECYMFHFIEDVQGRLLWKGGGTFQMEGPAGAKALGSKLV